MLDTLLDRLKTIFSIDLRSLALFRVGLALLIIADLISRARDLSAFYTDGGVLSRAESIANSHFLQVSLYWISGNQWFVGGLFVDPKWHGRGIGTKLIEHAESLHNNLTVEIFKQNRKGRSFYEKCGFRLIEEKTCEHTGLPAMVYGYERNGQ